jgi:hypothetical protein
VKSRVRVFALLIFALVIVALGGAGGLNASTARHCNTPDPNGRLFCVTVEDLDGVSPSGHLGSGADVQAYQFYKLTIANGGGSTLTNGSFSVVLHDNTPAGTVNSTAVYVPSAGAPFCAVVSTSPNRVDCSLANLGAGASTPTIVLGYRTSTTPGVTSTDAAVTVGFKEASNGPNGANPATLSFTENTSLEPDPESSVTWSPSGQNVQLSTTPGFDTQFSTLEYSVPAAKKAFAASLSESNGPACAPGIACFGELVTTDLSGADAGTFAAANVFHLRLTLSLDLLPGGNTKAIVMSHRLDSGAFEVISRRCGSNPPAASEALPCIVVTVDRKANLLTLDAWGFQNGGWHPGRS